MKQLIAAAGASEDEIVAEFKQVRRAPKAQGLTLLGVATWTTDRVEIYLREPVS